MSDEQETTEEREKKQQRKELKGIGWGCLGIFGLILEFVIELFFGIISCFG